MQYFKNAICAFAGSYVWAQFQEHKLSCGMVEWWQHFHLMTVWNTPLLVAYLSLLLMMVRISYGYVATSWWNAIRYTPSTEFSYPDQSSGNTFKFCAETGQLKAILSGLDSSNITVDYLNSTYPALFSHSNGKQMRLYYTSDEKVSYIDILDRADNIESSW